MLRDKIVAVRDNMSKGLANSGACSHPGLALTRYLRERGNEAAVTELLQEMQETSAGEAYRTAFARWKAHHDAEGDRVAFTGVAMESVAIGLGNASPIENGLTLQHTYGMPLLPASAQKGLCRRAVRAHANRLASPDDVERNLFGSTASAAYAVFFDAWFDPGDTELTARPFKRDVVTVHHPDYYREGLERPWPTDFDDPNPIPFLVVRPGTKFLFVLQMQDAGWLDFARNALQWGLANLGIGAKTNAGYGRLGEWQDLPRPPRKETWPNCELIRKMERGVVTVEVKSGPVPFTIPQNQWQPAARSWPEAWKEAFKKKNRASATLVVERDGEKVTLIEVATDTVTFG